MQCDTVHTTELSHHNATPTLIVESANAIDLLGYFLHLLQVSAIKPHELPTVSSGPHTAAQDRRYLGLTK